MATPQSAAASGAGSAPTGRAWRGLLLGVALLAALAARAQPAPPGQAQALLAASRAARATDTAASRRAAQQCYALACAQGLDSVAVRARIELGLNGVNDPKRAEWALRHLYAARAGAAALGMATEVARTYRGEGAAEESRERLAAAQVAYRTALAQWQRLGNAHEMMATYNDLGVNYRAADQYPEALQAHLQQLRLAEATHDWLSQSMALRNLGALSQVLADLPGAVAYTARALALMRRHPQTDTVALAGTYAALGIFYQELERYPLARRHLLAGLRLQEQLRSPEARIEQGFLLHGLGEVAAAEHHYQAAVPYYQHAARLFEQTNQPESLISALDALSLAQQQLGQAAPALRAAQRALALSHRTHSARSLANAYDNFSEFSALRRDFATAYRYQSRSRALSDSLFTVEKSAQLADFSARYQVGQKESQIRLLRGQAALTAAEARWQHRTRNLLGGGLLLALGGGAAAYRRYRLQRRTSQRLRAAEAEGRVRNEELESVQQRLRSSLADKETLIKEIHHRVKNNLQIVSSLLALQAKAHGRLPGVAAALRESQNLVKSIALAHELLHQADDLTRIDFTPFAEQLAAHLQRAFAVPAATVVVRGEGLWLDTDAAVPLGLIVNELLSNAFKYACADGRPGILTVTLGPDPAAPASYRLAVADDGPGLPANFAPGQTSSLGLRLVQSLARQMGGALCLPLSGQPGAEFVVQFPVPSGAMAA